MTSCVARRPTPPWSRRRILVASLRIRNQTTGTDDNFAAEREATAGLPRSSQKRGRRVAAAAAGLDLPDEILVWEIFVRLPAKDVLRCRAVCRSWHGLTSAPDFLRSHHRRQPSRPLVGIYPTTGRKGLPFRQRGRSVLAFDDNKDFTLLASCDGLLLLLLSDGRHVICNPTTRQCAPLSCVATATAANTSVVTLYMHRSSGEYRILYWKKEGLKAAYYILMVRRGRSSRCIGVPLDTPDTHGMPPVSSVPPVVLRNCVHWLPGCLHKYDSIVVFDTVAESFRFMQRPSGATRFNTRLCDMEGSIGFSCFDDGWTAAKIWVLEDYEREVWSFKYNVKFPVNSLRQLEDKCHLILSHKGDVLVYSCAKGYMFHCDNTGKLLEEFRCDPWSLRILGHWFKESLVKQDISLRRGCGCVGQLRFFQRI